MARRLLGLGFEPPGLSGTGRNAPPASGIGYRSVPTASNAVKYRNPPATV